MWASIWEEGSSIIKICHILVENLIIFIREANARKKLWAEMFCKEP